MSKIHEALRDGKVFIPFITCGDPDIETTINVVRAAVENDKAGITTDKVFDMVSELRRDVKVPLVFMTYANVVSSYGTDRFLKKCERVGIDGLILPDVPFEEKEEFSGMCEVHGFIYVVSSLGVTGVRSEITTDLNAIVSSICRNTDTPCAIGFGISTPEQARKMAEIADGVIVG